MDQLSNDYFIHENGISYAGRHVLIDCYGAQFLTDLTLMEETLKACVEACNATLLHIHLHHFNENDGISGVAVLAESHISVHTWPERDFAAFDIFMCGKAKPENALAILQAAFQPNEMKTNTVKRGLISAT